MTAEQTKQTIQQDQTYIMQTYARPPFVLDHGEGVYLYDTEGQRYLDFVAGIAVNALGYGDSEVAQVVADQASRLIHTSNLYHTAPGAALAEMLIEKSPGLDRVFFSNSGSESVEGAIKFARKYARTHYKHEKTTVVACTSSFHGRSMGAVAVTAREKYRTPFMPVMPGVRFTDFNNLPALYEAIDEDVCAVIMEPVQGEGGINVATPEFFERVRTLCDRYGACLIADEIQCGMGRTGSLWAYEQYTVQPDIMTVAKPLGGGLPIGAILMKQKIADALSVGEHGTTFGGGPLVTSVARVVLNRISQPDFLAHVRQVGDYLEQALTSLMKDFPEKVLEVRGRGLMRGIQVRQSAATIRQACQDRGLFVAISGEDVLRLLPPLIVEEAHVDEAMAVLREVLGVRC